MTIAVSAIALAERVAHVALGQRVDRGRAARQPRGDQRQDGRLRDQDDAEHDADQVAVQQQVRAGAEERRGGEGERELHRPALLDEPREVMDERHQHAADEQEDADVERHGADQLERPDLHDLRARARAGA